MAGLNIYDRKFNSRLLVGSARYPSPQIMADAIRASQTELVTVSLRRQQANPQASREFLTLLQQLGVAILPNTAGCETEQEAFTLAQMSRELFETRLIKLEVIGDNHTLQPDMAKTLRCAKMLLDDGFQVLPYCTDDLVFCRQLYDAGCQVIMPWAAPIGSGQGILNPQALTTLRQRLPDATLIVDAGLGKPSHAMQAMELGFDGVLLNTALAKAHNPVQMAQAFAKAVAGGREGFLAGAMIATDFAQPSTPVLGMPEFGLLNLGN